MKEDNKIHNKHHIIDVSAFALMWVLFTVASCGVILIILHAIDLIKIHEVIDLRKLAL